MAKKLYIVETQQVITQTWEYEFEVDDDDVELKTTSQIMEYIYDNGIEGHCTDDDEVIEENFMGHNVHPVEEKA